MKMKTNLEWLKENLTDKEKESRGNICNYALNKLKRNYCRGKSCSLCPFNKIGNLIDFLLEEYEEPEKKDPIKLTNIEHDILKLWTTKFPFGSEKFNDLRLTSILKRKGYFKDVKEENLTLDEILENCEVIQNENNGRNKKI